MTLPENSTLKIMAYYVYMLASRRDGVIYLGVTNNIVRRVYEHRTKAVPGFTSKYNITQLVWFEIYEDPVSAISSEKEEMEAELEGPVDRNAKPLMERFVRTRPQMCNCTSGNLEIPGSMLRIAPK